jgi:hypothetical protein
MSIGGPAEQNDVELGGGLRYLKSLGAFDLGAVAGLAYREAHDALGAEINFHAEFQLTWWPGKPLVAATP